MNCPAISLEHVNAGYGTTPVLEDVSFEIAHGEIFVLLGGSGCGKTTLMKHMIGLNPVLSGRLLISGMEWNATNRSELCRKIGVMFQSGALFGSMTCLENILLPLEEFSNLKKSSRVEKAMELLDSVELADAAGKMPSEISGGMRKRVAIARAMALGPDVVFLDEPGAGLDPITAAALDGLVLKLRKERNMTFVIVTHELASVFAIADRAAMFDRSRRRMIALGSPSAIASRTDDPFIVKFFKRGGFSNVG